MMSTLPEPHKIKHKEPVSLVERYLDASCLTYLYEKNSGQSHAETLQQTEECLKYLYLTGFVPGAVPISREIDHIWHLLILETEYYFSLCQRLPKKQYIHHSSHSFPKATLAHADVPQASADNEAARNLSWLLSYVKNFGDFTLNTVQYWPYATGIMKQLGLNIFEFNKKLIDLSGKCYL